MNVSVTPELEEFVQRLVASGRYRSANEVFRNGLRLLEESERRRLLQKWLIEGLAPAEAALLPAGLLRKARSRIRAEIQTGLDALERGETVDGEEFFARWRSRLKRATRPGRRPSPAKRRP